MISMRRRSIRRSFDMGDVGASPDATWIHEMTGGKDFILVGMGYREVEPSEYGKPESIRKCCGFMRACCCRVDPGAAKGCGMIFRWRNFI